MSAISSHFMPKGRNTSIVQVCSYKEKCMEGTLRFLRLEQECPFRNLMQFLSLMDAVMDLDNQPQRSVEPRVFGSAMSNALKEAHGECGKTQPIATFQISILFRQNASWQGNVLWVDENMESQFRSALELVSLMDNALSVSLEKADRADQ